ncbi:hypothetical protein BDY21DRAFT_356747 [Lineolata rhizophorae]|uniref:Uncharacterized protein n=1 Tax=Lineolata rhizophorae TaxID=578093 RepID=A0A6A6NP86_9PEZI|nr:hypothetical protein BDY21DRAFT_356747 [Lineolata rhizophorae]
MPHKHTRRKGASDSNFDLPPSSFARALPVGKTATNKKPTVPSQSKAAQKKERKRKGIYAKDDTPKGFLRLMKMRSAGRLPDGLDDGNSAKTKKRKRGQDEDGECVGGQQNDCEAEGEAEGKVGATEVPHIRPGERLADFAARVNQALPLTGLSRKGKHVEGMREKQTRHEKRLRRMQAEWRKEEERIRRKEEEEREVAEEKEEEQVAQYGGEGVFAAAGQVKKKRGKRRGAGGSSGGEGNGVEEDPWAVLKQTREQPKGLHDVVQAPPQLKVIPKEKFKVTNGAKVEVDNIPNAAGSLRRREELGQTRKSIIEGYRKMMGSKRGAE